MIFRCLFIASLLLTIPVGLQAEDNKTRFWPARIESVARVGKLVKITYDQPCGSEYHSTLLRPVGNEKRLLVSVLTTRNDGRCTKVTQKAEVYLRSIAADWELDQIPLESKFSMRSKVEATPILAHHVRVKDGKRLVEVAFTKACIVPKYLAIREEGRQLHLGLMDVDLRDPHGECKQQSPVSSTIPFINVSAINRIALLPAIDRPNTAAEQNRITVRQVAKLAFGPAGMRVSYRKKCNEVGIAIVLGPNQPLRRVGVLVTSFPEIECHHQEKTLAHLTVKQLKPIMGQKFASFKHNFSRGILSIDPAKVAAHKRVGQITRIGLSYVKSCESTIGTIYSNDRYGHLAIGVLLHKKAGLICNKPFHSQQLQDQLSLLPAKGKLHPMSLNLSTPETFKKTAHHSLLLPGWIKS